MVNLVEQGILLPLALVPLVLVVLMGGAPFILRSSAAHMARAVWALFALVWLCALVIFGLVIVHGPFNFSLLTVSLASTPVVLAGLLVDRVSASMLLLVVTVSGIVHLYSLRAMQEERHFRRYFFLLSLVTFEVIFVILANNLAMLGLFWILKGFTLTFLLAHYQHRAASWHAAWTKLRVDIVGDLAILGALALTWISFHTFSIQDFHTAILHMGSGRIGVQVTVLTLLLLIAAMAKSAQFPLHSWLPESVEAPTPVSALMHAGLINAGGFLLIRLSDLFVATPVTMTLAIVIGSLTALYGTMIMLTRNDVKGMLVYSTMGQMGFMILECGLGMFALALLHIIVHGLFKAHAFLNSGAVVQQKNADRLLAQHESVSSPVSARTLLVLGLLVALAFAVIQMVIGAQLNPGSLVLLFAWMTIIHALARMPRTLVSSSGRLLLGSVGLLAVILLYSIAIHAIEAFFAPAVAASPFTQGVFLYMSGVLLLLVGLVSLMLPSLRWPQGLNTFLKRFYVFALYSSMRKIG